MSAFLEMLREVENSVRAGYSNGEWQPHASPEGGTRTIGFGHKLSKAEEAGNFVEMPDGTRIDLNQRGLTEQEVEALLLRDVERHKGVARRQWNASQSTSFDSLSPLYQELLTEIAFNIGTLHNSSGNWGWPSLAKAMISDDVEEVKNQLMRSFTTSSGERRQLTNRVNRIKQYVDQALSAPQEPEEPVRSLTAPVIDAQQGLQSMMQDFLGTLTTYVGQQLQALQRGSQEPSETPAEPVLQDNDEQEVQWTDQEEAMLDGWVQAALAKGPVVEEDEADPLDLNDEEEDLMNMLLGIEPDADREAPVYAEEHQGDFYDNESLNQLF